MADIKIDRVSTSEDRTLPVFAEAQKLLQDMQQRAFALFAERGFAAGHALDDWLRAERELCWPAAELVEHEWDYSCELAIPGYEPAQVEVTATPREIIVHARCAAKSKSSAKDVPKTVAMWSGFGNNDVYRRIEFGADIDVARVNATLKNGILTITAPKREMPSQRVDVVAA
jgi:HSP20 family molecular chaperone IbpA